MPRSDRTEGHRHLIQIMNSPVAPQRVQAAAVKAVGALELTLMKLKLARYKNRAAREKQKANDPGTFRL